MNKIGTRFTQHLTLIGLGLLALVACQSSDPTPANLADNAITPDSAERLVLRAELGNGTASHIATHPSDDLVAVATTTGLALYDQQFGEQIAFFPTDEQVDDVAFSAEGDLLGYVTRPSNTLTLLDVDSLTPTHTLVGDPTTLSTVTFAPSGSLLAMGAVGGAALVDAETGSSVAEFTPPSGGQLLDLAFSPDGSLLAAPIQTGQSGHVQLWQTSDGQPAQTLQSPSDQMQLTSGQFSPDGSLFGAVGTELFAGDGATLVLWQTDQPTPVQTLTLPAQVFGQSWRFSPDGTRVAVGLMDGSVQLWDVASAEMVQQLSADDAGIATQLRFTPDGTGLVLGRDSGRVEWWDLATGTQRHSVETNADAILQLTATPNGNWLLVTSQGLLGVASAESPDLIATQTDHANGAIQSIAFAPNENVVATGAFNGAVTLWDTAEATPVSSLPNHHGAVQALAFDATASQLATGVGERISPLVFDDTVRIWSPAEGQLAQSFGGEREEVLGCSTFRNSVAFSPDGSLLASGSHDFTVQLWDTAEGQLVATLGPHQGAVFDITFSPDGQLIASASDDGFVRIWRADTFELVETLVNGVGAVTAVAFAPNGRWLASGTLFGNLDLWDTNSWELIASVGSNRNRFSDVAFSPDSSLLATGTDGDQIQLWEAPSLTPIGTLSGANGQVEALAFSSDGALLASGSSDGILRLWGVE